MVLFFFCDKNRSLQWKFKKLNPNGANNKSKWINASAAIHPTRVNVWQMLAKNISRRRSTWLSSMHGQMRLFSDYSIVARQLSWFFRFSSVSELICCASFATNLIWSKAIHRPQCGYDRSRIFRLFRILCIGFAYRRLLKIRHLFRQIIWISQTKN